MRALKSIVRWFFGLQGFGLMLVPLLVAADLLASRNHTLLGYAASSHAPHVRSIAGYGLFAGASAAIFAIGAIFAVAWWTSRKPRPTLNLWAIGASLITLAEGIGLYLLGRHYRHSSSGLDLLALGILGLVVFARRDAAPNPAAAPPQAISIAGDRTSVWTRRAVTALSWAAEIAAIFFWSRWAYTQALPRSLGLAWLVLITAATLLATFVHECGHALLAWCFQMGFLSFKVGPLQWRRRAGKWVFKFHPAGLLSPGGAVGAVPTQPNPPRWEEIVVILAGPAANLLLGVAAIWAVVHDSWVSYGQNWEFIAYAGSFSIIAGVLNLFPFLAEDGGYSDGARILQILTRSPLDAYHRVMAAIASTALTSRRYSHLDIAAIEHAASLFPRELRGLHLNLCASHYYQDFGRLADASRSLAAAETIYNDCSIDLPAPLHTVFVIGHAYLNRDAAAARLWWDRMQAKKLERPNFDYWLAQAALCWIEGRPAEAEDAWQKADTAALLLPQCGAYDFDRDRCALLRKEIDQGTPIHPAASAAATPAPPQPVSAPRVRHVPAAPAPAQPALLTPPAASPALAPPLLTPTAATASAALAQPLPVPAALLSPESQPASAALASPQPQPVPAPLASPQPQPVPAPLASPQPQPVSAPLTPPQLRPLPPARTIAKPVPAPPPLPTTMAPVKPAPAPRSAPIVPAPAATPKPADHRGLDEIFADRLSALTQSNRQVPSS